MAHHIFVLCASLAALCIAQLTSQRQLEQRVGANGVRPRISTTASATTRSTTHRATTTTTPRPFTGKPGCQFDIVLLVDCSGGAADKRNRYLALAADLVRSLDVGEFGAQVAMVRYSGPGRSDTIFHLKKHRNATTLIDDILNAPPSGGTTRTAEALRYARHEFDEKFGGRGVKAERSLVLFTDGHTQDDPSDAAIQLKRDRIHIYTVAIDDGDVPPNGETLRTIASDHTSSVLEAQFGSLKQRFANRRCH